MVDSDPVSNAMQSPQASLYVREVLKRALANSAGASADWLAQTHALLANVLMNDVLNGWNEAGAGELTEAQNAVAEALRHNGNLALAYHARGLVMRAQKNHNAALADFERAATLDANFARAHAQAGNERLRLGQEASSHQDFQKAKSSAPNHPATGYFEWGHGRAYFQERRWTEAIDCLTKSVKALTTVWYNRAYLAAAQHAAGDAAAVDRTKADFIRLFGKPTPALLASLQPAPTDPPTVRAARHAVHDLLKTW